MPEKKGDNKSQKTIFNNVDIVYTTEQPINNGEILSSSKVYEAKSGSLYVYEPGTIASPLYQNTYNTDNYLTNKPLSMNDLADYYSKHNNSIEETINYLADYINANKIENKQVVQQTISTLMENLRDHFDHTNSSDGAGSTLEIFEKCINARNKEEISGLVCGPICKTMKDILNKCDIPAAIVPVIKNVRHATLVYKQADNEYVFNDYGNNAVVKASNVLDAISEYSKREDTIHPAGSKRILDGKVTYSEYAFRDAAFRGEEMDIHHYNNDAPFKKSLKTDSSVNERIEISNLHNVTADVSVDLAKQSGNIQSELSFNAGYKTKGESSMFLSSKSFGIGAEYNVLKEKPKYSQFIGTKFQTAHINGTQGGMKYGDSSLYKDARELAIADAKRDFGNIDTSKYSKAEKEALNQDINKQIEHLGNTVMPLDNGGEPEINNFSNLSFFGRGYFGREYSITKSKTTNLKFSHQSSLDMLFSFDNNMNHSGDFRVAEEVGLKLENQGPKHRIETKLNAGVVADYNEQIVKGSDYATFGTKFNAGLNLACKPSQNSVLGVNTSMSSVSMPSARTFGYEGNIYTSVTNPKKNISFGANAGIKGEYQKLNLSFNEVTRNNQTFYIEATARKKNTEVFAGYNKHIDRLNNTRNYDSAHLGVRLAF